MNGKKGFRLGSEVVPRMVKHTKSGTAVQVPFVCIGNLFSSCFLPWLCQTLQAYYDYSPKLDASIMNNLSTSKLFEQIKRIHSLCLRGLCGHKSFLLPLLLWLELFPMLLLLLLLLLLTIIAIFCDQILPYNRFMLLRVRKVIECE